jgi:hypothetical protein
MPVYRSGQVSFVFFNYLHIVFELKYMQTEVLTLHCTNFQKHDKKISPDKIHPETQQI